MVDYRIVIEIPDGLEVWGRLALIGNLLLMPVRRAVSDEVNDLIRPWLKRRCRRAARRISRALRRRPAEARRSPHTRRTQVGVTGRNRRRIGF